MDNLTLEQVASVLLDAGVIYLNYGISAKEKLLAPTDGGNEFSITREYKTLTIDGARGKQKGLRRVLEENANIKVNLKGLTQENLKLALPGVKFESDVISNTSNFGGFIAEEDYLENVTLIVPNMGGKNKIFTIYNCINDEGITITTTDKEESIIEVNFSAHHDPKDKTQLLYKISEVDPSA
jgi:hypothetical protein